jgi:uncharacterized protein YjbI with pentapeptide repeats
MKAKSPIFLATGIVLLFFCGGPPSKAQLKDPANVTVEQKNLNEYLAALRSVHIDLGNPGKEPEEVKNHSIQIEYFIEAEGYRMNLLHHADLSHVNLSKCDLRFLNMGEANFSGTILDKADLRYSNMKECDFTGASLVGADFTEADLKEANFTGADLTKAVFDGADMHEATGLTVAQLLSCKSLSKTKLPEPLLAEVQKENPKLLK